MNTYDFEGQVAVVTGGGNGIGAAVAERLAASGARVAVWDLDLSVLDERVRRIPTKRILFQKVDVSDAEGVAEATEETVRAYGTVDVLVNSAGIAGPTSALADYPVEQWQRVHKVNVEGTFIVARAIIPIMVAQNYGRIVNIASIAGKEGNPNASAYSASKAAVIALTKSLGKELAAKDIAVNCVTPATAKTRILDQVSQEFVDYMISKIPRGRFVTVEEIASMVLWIASQENSFTTGAVFDLSGGRATY